MIETTERRDLIHPRQKDIPEWQGADTCVTSNFAPVKSSAVDHDLVVRTIYAKELTWLFFELQEAFNGLLDAGNKYRFFESLASEALKHLAAHQPETADYRSLLKAVLTTGFAYLKEIREYGRIIDQSTVVVHFEDTEGRQSRDELK